MTTINKPKILIWDIENLPNRGYFFNVYNGPMGTLPFIEKTHSIISIAYKWFEEGEAQVISTADFPKNLKKDPYDDSEVIKAFAKIYNEADYTVAHYGDKHDIKMFNSRVLLNGLDPLKPVQSIDTYKLVKKHFKLNTNKLDHIGYWLGEGVKNKMEAIDWVRCANGDLEAIKKMAEYNKVDVELLEKVFIRLLPYVDTKINSNLFAVDAPNLCPHCSSHDVIKRGSYYNKTGRKQILLCKSCSKYFNIKE